MGSLSMQSSLFQLPTRPSSSFSPNHEHLLSISSVSFPLKMKSRIFSGNLALRVKAYDSSSNQPSDSSTESTPPKGTRPKTRRDILLEYVQNVKPEFMELFVKRAPKHVVDAMRQTVTNMIGTLPPQFFAVTITSVAENLAQLMMSVLMTGYMFRNAQYRLELQQSLEQVALPEPRDRKWFLVDRSSVDSSESIVELVSSETEFWIGFGFWLWQWLRVSSCVNQEDDQDYAPGTQKNVSGEVIRWNNISGPEKIEAKKYIELLEAEIEELNRQELTSTAGDDVAVAMNTFVKRLLAVSDSDPKQMKTNVTETSATDLAKLLYWLMVVGYSLRNIEVRFDMERVLGTHAKLAELPPGEII
ncbi:unnamed protein product [Thlaspi arvense]|uniref:Uncharacterized protein n=1 Tax=Thlaspi arvense TaxID=13288 RepID=A0AAU9RU56_THLAR|nr:unnamed protein product [Thlaspi arvense]